MQTPEHWADCASHKRPSVPWSKDPKRVTPKCWMQWTLRPEPIKGTRQWTEHGMYIKKFKGVIWHCLCVVSRPPPSPKKKTPFPRKLCGVDLSLFKLKAHSWNNWSIDIDNAKGSSENDHTAFLFPTTKKPKSGAPSAPPLGESCYMGKKCGPSPNPLHLLFVFFIWTKVPWMISSLCIWGFTSCPSSLLMV